MTLLCPKYIAAMDAAGMDDMAEYAQQGHAYKLGDERVIALESGPVVEVAAIRDGWLGEKQRAPALVLQPLPMRYFHGEVPR